MQAIKYAVEYSDNFTYLYIAHSLGSLTYDDMRGIPGREKGKETGC